MRFFAQLLSVTLCALLISGPVSAQSASDLTIKVLQNKRLTAVSVQVADTNGVAVPDAAVVFRFPDEGPAGVFADGTRAAVAYTDASGRASAEELTWGTEPGTHTLRILATRGVRHGQTEIDRVVATPAPPKIESAQPAESVKPAANPPVSTPPALQAPVQPGTLQSKRLPEIASETPAPLPRVTVTNAPSHERLHSGGGKKWLILALVAAGAGAGVAVMGKGKSGSSSTSTSTGITIGNPTVSVGHP